LFTKKDKLTPAFMSAIAEVRDKLRFYVVVVAEKNPSAENVEIQKQYEAEKLPKLMILESFDATNQEVLKEQKQVVYEKTEFKYQALVNFFEDYARKEKKDEIEEMMESKIDDHE